MPHREIPYRDMVKRNQTLHEVTPITMDHGYQLRTKVKAFVLLDRAGKEYKRGPCISLQLFHNDHFIKALALPPGIEGQLIDRLQQASLWL